jgi:hypothetical protein
MDFLRGEVIYSGIAKQYLDEQSRISGLGYGDE